MSIYNVPTSIDKENIILYKNYLSNYSSSNSATRKLSVDATHSSNIIRNKVGQNWAHSSRERK
jgi:hypothetical protein